MLDGFNRQPQIDPELFELGRTNTWSQGDQLQIDTVTDSIFWDGTGPTIDELINQPHLEDPCIITLHIDRPVIPKEQL